MTERFKFRTWDEPCEAFPDGCMSYDSIDICKDTRIGDVSLIEQCIGLKDITGKLIYDGDIVEYEDKLYIVEWHHRGGYNGYEITNNSGGGVLWTEMLSSTVVIGNIHENKDLIKQAEG